MAHPRASGQDEYWALSITGPWGAEIRGENGFDHRLLDISGDRDVDSGVNVVLTDVALRGGETSEGGGAVRLDGGHLTLDTVRVHDNHARHGGGVAIEHGTFQISDSTFTDNSAATDGRGLWVTPRGSRTTRRRTRRAGPPASGRIPARRVTGPDPRCGRARRLRAARSSGSTTTGRVLATVDPAPENGADPAQLGACGHVRRLHPVSAVVVGCGSLYVEVLEGGAEVELPNGAIITVPDGVSAFVEEQEDGSYVVEHLAGDGVVTVHKGEQELEVGPGGSLSIPLDETPPVIVARVSGTAGMNGWHTGDVSVTWTVKDAESHVTGTTGCEPASVVTDTSGVQITCEAVSEGGSYAVARCPPPGAPRSTSPPVSPPTPRSAAPEPGLVRTPQYAPGPSTRPATLQRR